jgi:hypothetical protein
VSTAARRPRTQRILIMTVDRRVSQTPLTPPVDFMSRTRSGHPQLVHIMTRHPGADSTALLQSLWCRARPTPSSTDVGLSFILPLPHFSASGRLSARSDRERLYPYRPFINIRRDVGAFSFALFCEAPFGRAFHHSARCAVAGCNCANRTRLGRSPPRVIDARSSRHCFRCASDGAVHHTAPCARRPCR